MLLDRPDWSEGKGLTRLTLRPAGSLALAGEGCGPPRHATVKPGVGVRGALEGRWRSLFVLSLPKIGMTLSVAFSLFCINAWMGSVFCFPMVGIVNTRRLFGGCMGS